MTNRNEKKKRKIKWGLEMTKDILKIKGENVEEGG